MSLSYSVVIGAQIYAADVDGVLARGFAYEAAELDAALKHRVCSILWDDSGRAELAALLSRIADQAATTQFASQRVLDIVDFDPKLEDWRVGEALAESYLVDHYHCEFPWPMGRDLRNPDASPAGTDLVGFQQDGDDVRFAFGEVKTSFQALWPPSVMTGRHGLVYQLERLRDSSSVKDALVRYLAHHVDGKPWMAAYQRAASRYLDDPADVTLFGFLIRDVQPKSEDLASRASALADNRPLITSIELRALYLPTGTIPTLVDRARTARGQRP